MELNDFEKRIQQKMEELAIPPSESVWAHIDKRIPKKNRRKRIFFIVLFAALFLSMGYWIFNPWKKINDNEIVTKNISEVIAPKKDDSSFKFKQSINSKKDSLFKPGNSFHLLSHQKNLKNENRLVRSNRKAELSFQNTLLLNAQKEITPQKDFDKKFSEEKLLSQKNERNHLQRVTDLFKNKILLFKKDENEIVHEITQEEIQNIAGTINAKRIGASVTKSSDSIINQDQKRKLTFGFTFSAGQSYVANEIFDLTQSGSAYQYLSPGVGNSTGSRFFLPPVTKKSTAFLAGVFLEKNISLKSKISLGINYKYFSTINITGNKIDSIQTAFTSITYVNSYRNNFHYVELPVSLKFQLTNNNLLPVYWLVGFNISELINSNALQFKNDPGVYYNDNSLFNKTQLGFNTGFFATFFSDKNTPVNIGPYFSFSATKMANKGFYDKKHFHFIGISAEILFNKK